MKRCTPLTTPISNVKPADRPDANVQIRRIYSKAMNRDVDKKSGRLSKKS
jgi:hypothetical protein